MISTTASLKGSYHRERGCHVPHVTGGISGGDNQASRPAPDRAWHRGCIMAQSDEGTSARHERLRSRHASSLHAIGGFKAGASSYKPSTRLTTYPHSHSSPPWRYFP